MVRTRNDFSSEVAYLEYTCSIDFLKAYSLEGKTAKQIQHDMRIDEDCLHYVEKALSVLQQKSKMRGIHMIYQVDDFIIEDEDYEEWINAFSL